MVFIMDIQTQAILKTTIYISLLFLASCVFGKSAEVPKSVKNTIRTEGVFATLILLPAFFEWTFYDITIISATLFWIIFFNLLGLFWFALANYLFRGKKWARTLCLVLSVLRLFTFVGIPFSAISLTLLRKQEAVDFFEGRWVKEPDPDSGTPALSKKSSDGQRQ